VLRNAQQALSLKGVCGEMHMATVRQMRLRVCVRHAAVGFAEVWVWSCAIEPVAQEWQLVPTTLWCIVTVYAEVYQKPVDEAKVIASVDSMMNELRQGVTGTVPRDPLCGNWRLY